MREVWGEFNQYRRDHPWKFGTTATAIAAIAAAPVAAAVYVGHRLDSLVNKPQTYDARKYLPQPLPSQDCGTDVMNMQKFSVVEGKYSPTSIEFTGEAQNAGVDLKVTLDPAKDTFTVSGSSGSTKISVGYVGQAGGAPTSIPDMSGLHDHFSATASLDQKDACTPEMLTVQTSTMDNTDTLSVVRRPNGGSVGFGGLGD